METKLIAAFLKTSSIRKRKTERKGGKGLLHQAQALEGMVDVKRIVRKKKGGESKKKKNTYLKERSDADTQKKLTKHSLVRPVQKNDRLQPTITPSRRGEILIELCARCQHSRQRSSSPLASARDLLLLDSAGGRRTRAIKKFFDRKKSSSSTT